MNVRFQRLQGERREAVPTSHFTCIVLLTLHLRLPCILSSQLCYNDGHELYRNMWLCPFLCI